MVGALTSHAEADPKFIMHSKGKVSVTSHFPGLVVWSDIMGNKGTFLVRTDNGVIEIKAVLSAANTCEEKNLKVCFEGKIKTVKNAAAFVEGDTFKLGIDAVGKKEYFSFTSGFFNNVDVSINLQKIVLK